MGFEWEHTAVPDEWELIILGTSSLLSLVVVIPKYVVKRVSSLSLESIRQTTEQKGYVRRGSIGALKPVLQHGEG